MKFFLCKEIILNTSTNNQNPSESTSESTNGNIEVEQKKNKSGKSNSELMTEFFSINSDMDKNENFEEKRWHWT